MKQKLYLALLSVLALSTYAMAEEEEDTRTPVTVVSATTNLSVADIAGFGKETNYPKFTMSEGSVAYVNGDMTHWNKKSPDGSWEQYDEDLFGEGIYCLSVQVRIEGEFGLAYILSDDWQLMVNGESWQTVGPSIGSKYCYAPAYSPEIIVKDDSGVYEISDESSGRGDIYTMQGILVKRAATDEDLSLLPPGTYIYKAKKIHIR